jgi:hypothetical protein
MTRTIRRRHTLASTFALCAIPTLLAAQDHQPEPASPDRTAGPATFSFVLSKAGDDTLAPFGTTGRREVLQLQAGRTALRGQFRRARLDRLGQNDWTSSGWYEIRGGIIQLYHSDANGNATGRVEVGRYLENTICLNDLENGQPLAFSYLEPAAPATTSASASSPAPTAAPAATPAIISSALPPDETTPANSCTTPDGST